MLLWSFEPRQSKLVQVSGEFELTKFELADGKWLTKWGQIEGKSDFIWVRGDFKLTEFGLVGFYCIIIIFSIHIFKVQELIEKSNDPKVYFIFPLFLFFILQS